MCFTNQTQLYGEFEDNLKDGFVFKIDESYFTTLK